MDARILGICGTGEQAHAHLRALSGIRDFERCLIWGRSEDKVAALVAASRNLGLCAESARDARRVAETADVICTTTSAREPYLRGEWIRPGTHLNLVGSSVPTTSEVDSRTLAGARLFVDYRDSALALGGEIRRAIAQGIVPADPITGEIGEVLLGLVRGRRSADEITVFKSLGMVSEDLLVAQRLLDAAEAEDAGLLVDF
jgi:ornithine cyclodeaminase